MEYFNICLSRIIFALFLPDAKPILAFKKEHFDDGDPSFREKVNKNKCDLNYLRDNLVIKCITAVKDDIVMRLCN